MRVAHYPANGCVGEQVHRKYRRTIVPAVFFRQLQPGMRKKLYLRALIAGSDHRSTLFLHPLRFSPIPFRSVSRLVRRTCATRAGGSYRSRGKVRRTDPNYRARDARSDNAAKVPREPMSEIFRKRSPSRADCPYAFALCTGRPRLFSSSSRARVRTMNNFVATIRSILCMCTMCVTVHVIL